MNKQDKINFIPEFKDLVNDYPFMLVTRQSGISVSSISKLRRQIKESDGQFCVVKNNLAKLALKDACDNDLIEMFSGPVAVVFSKNPVNTAKITIEFESKNEKKFEVVGGILDGKILSHKEVKSLSSLPSLEVLRAKLLGVLVANSRNLLSVIAGPARQMVYLLDTYTKK